MQVLAHRGCWTIPAERNSEDAFIRAFDAGFGVETDLRDCRGVVVISHDPPHGGEMSLWKFLELYKASGRGRVLALNIKADGLQAMVLEAINFYAVANYFAFDSSIPDLRSYHRAGIRTFTRQSECEPEPTLYDRAAGVWIDSFEREWFDARTIQIHLNAGKEVCIVSSELHSRDHRPLWERLRGMPDVDDSHVMLCTDFPAEASEWFNG